MIHAYFYGGLPLSRLLQEHAYLITFVTILMEFSGIPIPSGLLLLFTSALAPTLGISPSGLVAAAVPAALIPETGLFLIGRWRGMRIIQLYCKVTLGSRSCTERTTRFFQRLGPKSLLISKFVPGFSTFASPMAGLSGISLPRFWIWAGLGALSWSGILVVAGHGMGLSFLQHRIDWIGNMRSRLHWGLAAAIVVYLCMKFYVRVRSGPPSVEDVSVPIEQREEMLESGKSLLRGA